MDRAALSVVPKPTQLVEARDARADGMSAVRLTTVWLLVVISVVSWRTRQFYAGGVDPVVAAKGVLSLIALVLAGQAVARAPRARAVGARSLCIVTLYALASALGGASVGSLAASAVLSARVLLVAATVVLVLMAYPVDDAIWSLVLAMGAVGVLTAVTGAGSLARTGRLYGGIFPLSPNQIALLIAPLCLYVCWRLLQGQGRSYDPYLAAAFMGLTWLTGSRSGLLGLALALVVMVLQSRLRPSAFVAVTVLLAGTAWVVLSTSIVANFFGRGGTASVTTLNSRTIAWSAAFGMKTDFWQHWFGGGYAMKTIQVTGTFWDTQVIDSSWVVAYVQAGVVGLTLLGVWALASLCSAFRAPRQQRALYSAIVVFCLIRSFLESGLLDAQSMFLIIFPVALASERATWQARQPAAAVTQVQPKSGRWAPPRPAGRRCAATAGLG